jgi:hypothetical protein
MSDHQQPLSLFLRDSDARCPACGYALRGCTSDKCPECGRALALTIASGASPGSASWIAAVLGCGLSGLIAIVLLIHSLEYVAFALHNPGAVQTVRAGFAPSSDLPRWSAVFGPLLLAMLSLAALAWLVARRRTFLTWTKQRRAWIALVCWLSPIIMLALIASWIGA